ncbi:WYL domain-containing protein [Algoriphagus sp. D3-2-R+10]|uniref:helix-turn-helix transcriptional regulator n=1 Tax=Algoriphagus aurantiacus TaxID=3103948 RepID=UPI002B37869E|nr:WYL domain-containing protein [Algoriphagus sp. D3-2-R+10]MEB2777482.1 WYL domain-containing protein [Algoriphagus sp. D3-2-R+10]
MSLSKQAHIRYMTIDSCLRNSEGVFMEELIRECKRAIAFETGDILENISISKRTLQDDLKFFRETYNAEIIKERRDVPHEKQHLIVSKSKLDTYRYADRTFSIANLPINKKERESMLEALGVLYRLSHMSSFHWLKETIQELQIIRNEGIPDEKIISFEESSLLKGIDFLRPLYEAIFKKSVLEIKYFSFKQNQEFDFTISPYFLKQYNKRWFLFGKSHTQFLVNPNRLLNLPLDRISLIQKSEKPYIRNEGLNSSEYFKDIIGVTFEENSKKEDIKIKIDSSQFHYIESKPLHESQVVLERNSDHVTIMISVYPNIELESLILSKGDFFEVISPDYFRRNISERIKKMSEKYQNFSRDWKR